ncbi:Uncharacterised protein [Cardiobacterium valvarum]|uniref:Uncharacterized protein n=1 Tax=Cardiobacterium valvarum TaxID=194702 RepID=A0A381DWX1_9GAMM|nr:Uncharacterised protein [Cardiobacterium valvarum]
MDRPCVYRASPGFIPLGHRYLPISTPNNPCGPLISSGVINSNNSCADNRLSIPPRSAGAVISRPFFVCRPDSRIRNSHSRCPASLRSLCSRHTCRQPALPHNQQPLANPFSRLLLPALHPVARALQQFAVALYPPAVVVILCRFPRRNFRIRQQYPRRHRLPRRLQPHAVHFCFQRGMPPFAPLGDLGNYVA